MIHLDSKKSYDGKTALKMLFFCNDCPSPELEGSFVKAIVAKYGPQHYALTAETVFGLPNHGDCKKFLNRFDIMDRIVLLDRGKITLYEKALKAQHAGAKALIVLDDGQCDESFSKCGSRVGSVADGGVAAFDDKELWSNIRIPVLVISASNADKLKSVIVGENVEIPGYGLQYLTKVMHRENKDL